MQKKPYVLGLDMGGTNSVLGVVDARGHVLARTSIKTQSFPDINDYVNALYEEAVKIVDSVGGMELIRGIGAGVPNGNYYTGYIQGAMNLPWHTVPFAEMMSERFGLPCKLTNDANGKVVYGHDGFAGELGHTCAVRGEEGRPCNCGKKGCLEAYASATGVARTAKEIISSTTKETVLRNLDIDAITSKDVYDAAEQGDEVAKEIFDFTGTILGQQLADFVAFSAPEAIVLFGGLTKSGHWIKDPVEKALNANVLPLWRDKVAVLFSDLKEADAAVLGASALAWGE